MTDSVRDYFRGVLSLWNYIQGARSANGYGQLFNSRRTIADRQAVWQQLRLLHLQKNQAFVDGIGEMQSNLFLSFERIQTEYEVARSQMPTLRICGEVGTATGVVAKLTERVVTWLVADSNCLQIAYPSFSSLEELRELRGAIADSDSRFPIGEGDFADLREALQIQQSCVLGHGQADEPVGDAEAGAILPQLVEHASTLKDGKKPRAVLQYLCEHGGSVSFADLCLDVGLTGTLTQQGRAFENATRNLNETLLKNFGVAIVRPTDKTIVKISFSG